MVTVAEVTPDAADIEEWLKAKVAAAAPAEMVSIPVAYRLIALELREFCRHERQSAEDQGASYLPYAKRRAQGLR